MSRGLGDVYKRQGFQRRTSLRVDGVCGCNSWKKISTAVLGVGRTKTTID